MDEPLDLEAMERVAHKDVGTIGKDAILALVARVRELEAEVDRLRSLPPEEGYEKGRIYSKAETALAEARERVKPIVEREREAAQGQKPDQILRETKR